MSLLSEILAYGLLVFGIGILVLAAIVVLAQLWTGDDYEVKR